MSDYPFVLAEASTTQESIQESSTGSPRKRKNKNDKFINAINNYGKLEMKTEVAKQQILNMRKEASQIEFQNWESMQLSIRHIWQQMRSQDLDKGKTKNLKENLKGQIKARKQSRNH